MREPQALNSLNSSLPADHAVFAPFSRIGVRMQRISIKINRLHDRLFDNRIFFAFQKQDSHKPPFKSLLRQHLEGDSRPPCGGVD